ncbi:MAG TPA: serine hydrolase domain-containing protein [Nitrososphaeraceae archaeon]|nr:serine hydrolase domain-containing protein [Nitrososphaeraceae archaeon]
MTGKERISVLLVVIVILIGSHIASTAIKSIHSSESITSFPKPSLQKKIEEQKIFKITEKLKETIQSLVNNNKTNAAIVVGLVDPNGTQFYGYGNMSNANPITVDKDTIFAIGSITKVFTTILLADMVNSGLVNLDDPIEKYFPPSVKAPTYNGQKITLENLATHTSGLPEFPGSHCVSNFNGTDDEDSLQARLFFIECDKNYTFDQLYQDLSNTTLTSEPGLKFEYSTFGISLLGHILALKSGISYDRLLEERILNVLGMNSTSIVFSDAQKSRLAIGHLNGKELPFWNTSRPIAPAGGLHSSVADMLKFASANLGLIDTKINTAMKESHIIIHDSRLGKAFSNNYTAYVSLGWIIATDFGIQIVEHNGETADGYNSFIALNTSKERGIVIIASASSIDIDIANIVFGPRDDLSRLIWNLLTN